MAAPVFAGHGDEGQLLSTGAFENDLRDGVFGGVRDGEMRGTGV